MSTRVWTLDTAVTVVARVDRPQTKQERKRFAREAAAAIARELLARGAIKVQNQYDLESDTTTVYAVVRAARPARELP